MIITPADIYEQINNNINDINNIKDHNHIVNDSNDDKNITRLVTCIKTNPKLLYRTLLS